MIENQMTVYRESRMSWMMAQEVAAYYAERRRNPVKAADKPCVTAPTKNEGSRFHARG